ncbi:MAG: hypothetical protein HQM13_02515 [SAR324 cluster bacterium]|nr:hypothetical protein [SAR324 cluster bacterium]
MKKILLSILVLTGLTAPSFAVETLFELEEIKDHGLYIAPVLKKVHSYDLLGTRALWVFNHKFAVGYGTYTSSDFKVDNAEFRKNPNNADFNYQFQYGGVELEYVYDHASLIHYHVQSLIGIGKLDRRAQNIGFYNFVNSTNKFEESDFTIFEFGGGAELNLHQYFRLFAGLNYLYVDGVKYAELSRFDESPTLPHLSGIALVLGLKLGTF